MKKVPPRRVPLTTDSFRDALRKYIQESKPDPLAKRQLEGWVLEWKEADDNWVCNDDDDDDDRVDDTRHADHLQEEFRDRLVVKGTLEITGEYVGVALEIQCYWSLYGGGGRDGTSDDGELGYFCNVVYAWMRRPESPPGGADSADSKSDARVRRKVLARLKKDWYISRLLPIQPIPCDGPGGDGVVGEPLATAFVLVNRERNLLEERVDVTDMVAEAVRRALWPASESSLDMMEVILALPSLPCRGDTASDPGHSTEPSVDETTPLANRAKLRLLEDAMVDACEREGEGELAEDLKISPDRHKSDTAATKNELGDELKSPSKKKKSKRR